MRLAMIAVFITLTGCSMFLSPEAQRERARQERFDSCMSKTVGPFGVFQSMEARQKAAETCKSVMDTPP